MGLTTADRTMKTARRRLGERGESLAADELSRRGYEIVDRNWYCRVGEVDVVAKKQDEWVFFEVRTRRGRVYGSPEESLTAGKMRRMRSAAQAYLTAHALVDVSCRLGFVAVEMDSVGRLLRIDVYEIVA